ncbi:MAG: helix-turn-helix domain-containing protein [Methylobacter sp.]
MTIEERLKEERRRLGFNQPDFAALAGRTKKTLIDYEKGMTSPDAKFLAAIAAAGADVQYILTGIRSSAALTPDEQMLLSGYRTLDARGKAGVFGVIGGLTQSPTSVGQQFNGTVGQVVHGDIASNKFKVKPEEK